MPTETEVLEQLEAALRENRLRLPTLPEVALQVRESLTNGDPSAQEIAQTVSTDPALSVRLLQVANSPLYRGRSPAADVAMAVRRLGNNLVRTLVTALVMRQVFQPTNDATDARFRALWEESVQVAAFSRVLTSGSPNLSSDRAMLAGLIHNVGALPLLVLAEDMPDVADDPQRLGAFLDRFSPTVGTRILQGWKFPESLTAVTSHFGDLSYDGGPTADYVDVVLVARSQVIAGHGPDAAARLPLDAPCFQKLGLDPDTEIIELEGAAEQVNETRGLFLH